MGSEGSEGSEVDGWEEYQDFLDEGPYSVKVATSNLAPQNARYERVKISIPGLSYTLWPFQEQILAGLGEATLILGLPTGLGKTYLAGARLYQRSQGTPIRVLFLTPSIPLGVQQTMFAREKLGVDAVFVSGGIPADKRAELKVWNNPYVVATPQTFYNDNLDSYRQPLQEAREHEDPIDYLSGVIRDFPYDFVVADECQRYIGDTDGYSILLAARACDIDILALSATPQLHNPDRLQELEKVFTEVQTFSVEDPGIKQHMPERLLVVERVNPPDKLMRVYKALGKLIRLYYWRIRKKYGPGHDRYCTKHPLCRVLLAVRMLRRRLMEDGASGVQSYKTWSFRDLRNKRKSLDGDTIYNAYQEALRECPNHKLEAAKHILNRELYSKAIVYIESVEATKQLATQLQRVHGVENVACLTGRGDMSMDQQASALLHFQEKARILVCTSVGEEGLDIPSAELEVWVDPPSNPRKWIQRFGRILRQPGDKEKARVHAIATRNTHEKKRLLSVKKQVEKTYGFTQQLEIKNLNPPEKGQKNLTEYMR